MNRTALYERHRALGARMTDFHGWEMPLYYTSIIEEHRAVREALGVFDISHMGQVIVTGPDAAATLNEVMVSEIGQTGIGRACYTLMANQGGGIIDDVIVYRTGEESFLVIVNCGTRAGDIEWLMAHRVGETTVMDVSHGRSILAVQGPLACRVLEQILDARVTSLGRFDVAPIRTMGPEACLARTGYTGGDGFELFLPDGHALRVWEHVLRQAAPLGGIPAGLGARDTLRVEAGLRLYGSDMDTATNPYEAGLGWTVAVNKPHFIGKEAILRQKAQGLSRAFVGFELPQGPVPRAGCEITTAGSDGARRIGVVTSGTFSPALNRPLGMGYVEPAYAKPGSAVAITIRSRRSTGTVVRLPFWSSAAQAAALRPAQARALEREG